MPIPEILHQTAVSTNIPPKWQRYQQILRDLHPSWNYNLWTDVDNDAFVAAHYPNLLEAFRGMPYGIMRADVIRYLVLHSIGGVYVDMDYEFFRAFDLLGAECVMPLETEPREPRRLGNAIFASAPQHHFLARVIADLELRPPHATSKRDVLAATGPLFLTRIYDDLPEDARLDIQLPPKRLFSPTTPRGPREYRVLVRRGEAYGVHHCDGTWREFSSLQRLKQRIARLVY